MRCPYCGFEVSPTKFCENCGSPLPVEAELPADVSYGDASSNVAEAGTSPFESTTPSTYDQAGAANAYQSYGQPTNQTQAAQPTGGYAYQPTQQQAVPNSYQQPGEQGSYTGASQFTGSLSPNAAAAAGVGTVPNTAFGLAIAGLVLVVTGIGFFIGLILCIVALVMNAKNNKSGLANPHKTSTNVMSIIGIVLSVLTLVIVILTASLIAQIYPILERNDFDPDRIEFVVDEKTGEITVIEKPASSSGRDAKSSSASSTSTQSSSAASSSASASASSATPVDTRAFDSLKNPTLYALVNMNGADLAAALDSSGFEWEEDVIVWFSDNGSMLYMTSPSGDLSLNDVKKLEAGSPGKPVVSIMSLAGYSTPKDAFAALSKDVTVEKTAGDNDTQFAIVKNQKGTSFFVLVENASEGNQALAVFNEEALAAGMANSMLNVNTKSISELWSTLEEMGYVSAG